MAAALIDGHPLLAEWLWLIAAVVWMVVAVLAWTGRPDPTRGALLPVGLVLLAVGWLVL